MHEHSMSFRDFGLLPKGQAPADTVRCYFGTGHVIGQYAGTGLMAVVGVGLSVVLAVFAPFPANILAPIGVLALGAGLLYLIARHDYAWVELQGSTIRAKHLYTRQVIERRVDEIEDLLTVVIPVQNLATMVTAAWLGRIKAVKIRFRDGRAPIPIMRSDPAMTNAQEFIEAIMFRMSEVAPLDAEIVNLDGKPLVKRVFWKALAS